MNALCPYCFGDKSKACNRCTDGRIAISFGNGPIYKAVCEVCGFVNGGGVAIQGMAKNDEWPCVECGGGVKIVLTDFTGEQLNELMKTGETE